MVRKNVDERFLAHLREALRDFNKSATTTVTTTTSKVRAGETHPKAKHSQRRIDLIRMLSTLGFTVSDIKELTGINKGYLTRIVTNQVWKKHMTPYKATCKKNGKLSYNDAEAIRAKYTEGLSQKQLAQEYGITQCTVSMIINGKMWTREEPYSKKSSTSSFKHTA